MNIYVYIYIYEELIKLRKKEMFLKFLFLEIRRILKNTICGAFAAGLAGSE